MASKTYVIMKGGEEIGKVKTLTAAKQMADENGAEVYTGGNCVYQGKVAETAETDAASDVTVQDADETSETTNVNDAAQEPQEEQSIVTAEPVVSKKLAQPETEEAPTEKYRLKALMNVRKAPSMDAEIVATKPEDTLVRVLAVEDDWLHLADGNYILYGGGRFAKKA